MIFNENLTFSSLPQGDQRAFRLGRPVVKELLPAGTRLYKWTEHSLADPKTGRITPWWSFADPIQLSSGQMAPGLPVATQRARTLGVKPAEFARARAAVTQEWNAMSHLLQARLLQPVWGFVGQAAHQRLSNSAESGQNIFLIGGDVQVYLPNLTSAYIAAKS